VFQSLSGFQVRCNFQAAVAAAGTEGGFNPYRVFKFVATIGIERLWKKSWKFQSLSGFQVRCNAVLTTSEGVTIMVSIPIGFSSSLQLWLSSISSSGNPCFNPYRVFKFVATQPRAFGIYDHNKVSIPIGFSSSLQPLANGTIYWRYSVFQSLSGFQVRCNQD